MQECCREGHYCQSLEITAVQQVSQEVYRKPLSNTFPVIDKQGFDQDNWEDIGVRVLIIQPALNLLKYYTLNAKKTGEMENLGQIAEFNCLIYQHAFIVLENSIVRINLNNRNENLV